MIRRKLIAVKEATARIKINKLLETVGWCFFAEESAPVNFRLKSDVIITSADLDALDNDFEKSKIGFIDFLLLESRRLPLIVLVSKAGEGFIKR